MNTPDNHPPDDFDAIIQSVRQEVDDIVSYTESSDANYFSLRLDGTLAALRTAFASYRTAYFDMQPGASEVPYDYFSDIVDSLMNTRDLQSIRADLMPHDVVTVDHPGGYVYQEYFEGWPVGFSQLNERETLVGTFRGTMTVQASEMGEGAPPVYEPALIIVAPHIEYKDGDVRDLGLPFVCVPFLNEKVRFTKRFYRNME